MSWSSRRLKQPAPWALALLALFGVLAVAAPDGYPTYVGHRAVAFGVAALGPAVLLVYGGRSSLGHAALMATGAYACAAMLRIGAPAFAGLALGGVTAAALGAGLGAAFAHLRGPSFAVATLAVQVGFDQAALRFPAITGGHMGIMLPRPAITAATIAPILVALAAMAALSALRERPTAARWSALRDRPDAAAVSGIALRPAWAALGALSGALSGVGGAVLVLRSDVLHPGQFTLLDSVELLIVATLGGAGAGALLAAAAAVVGFAALADLGQLRSLAWAGLILALGVFRPRALRPGL